jgi:hypothetical protein
MFSKIKYIGKNLFDNIIHSKVNVANLMDHLTHKGQRSQDGFLLIWVGVLNAINSWGN